MTEPRTGRSRAAKLARDWGRHLPPPETATRRPDNNFELFIDAPQPPAAAQFDWRSHPGVVTPSGPQGACNACASFAITAAIESLLRIANPNDQRFVSPWFLHTCIAHSGQFTDPIDDCRRGADLAPTVQRAVQIGYAIKGPATPAPFPANQCPVPQRAQINATPIQGPNEAKARILVAPIVTEMAFWADFFDCKSGVYKPVEQGSIYGHCVAVIGYSATGWIIKNSMGPTWGDHGVTTIPYGRCGIFAPLPPGMPHSDGFALSIA